MSRYILLSLFSSLYLLLASFGSQASIISNNDIASINFNSPDGWKILNTHQLFDGISDRFSPTRFAAYQKKGDDLSDTNVFNISVSLITGVNVSSISFFNDWNNLLRQQVASMNVELYGANSRLLWADSFSGLQQNTWDKINLVEFAAPVLDVTRIDFNINAKQSDHIEIRELLIGSSNDYKLSQAVEASSPSIWGLFLVIGFGLCLRHFLNTKFNS